MTGKTEGFSRFTRLTLGPSATELSVSADQGRQVIVERTTDFSSWTSISTNIAWEGVLEATDLTPPGSPPAFYRARTGNSP